MVKGDVAGRIDELRRALQRSESAAFLVEPRVIRRVIRELHGFVKLSVSVPHALSQIVSRSDVQHLVHPDELGLESFTDLPERCLLICQPEEAELEHWPLQELLQQVWRRLFHAVLDLRLSERLSGPDERSRVQQRIAELGQAEFDEAHFVLRNEQLLIHPESRAAAWREFSAVYLELRWFEPDLLPIWFPSLSETTHVEPLLAMDVDAEALFRSTQLYGAALPDLTPHVIRDETRLTHTRRDWSAASSSAPSDRAWLRALRRRDRANERGNTVAAVVHSVFAANAAATDEKRFSAEEKIRADVACLVQRLRRAISFPAEETEDWQASLRELASNAVQGFWNSERRLLYDLQKVCIDHERTIYRVDLVKWVASRGKRPLRRPLDGLREVLMTRHLASAERRLADVRLSGVDRERLTALLQRAASLSEEQMRQRMRPVLLQTLQEVQLVPTNIPEQVAADKLVEDALDCISDRGYLTLGYLRDSISRNDLKLPDLSDIRDLWRGDYLLRADDRLELAMDGVYRRGEFYLRALQTTSSIFFGNRAGRFATLFLIIPFGGAYVTVTGAEHMLHRLPGNRPASTTAKPLPEASLKIRTAAQEAPVPPATESAATMVQPAPVAMPESDRSPVATVAPVLMLGFLLMALIHVGGFRRRFLRIILSIFKAVRRCVVDYPVRILRQPIVQWCWRNRTVVRIRRVVVVPTLAAAIPTRLIPALFDTAPHSNAWWLGLSVLSSLALNSRLGRDTQELTAEWLAGVWHSLHVRVVLAILVFVLDAFRILLSFLERFLYAVDEWLRFHSDESWLSIVVKAVLGVIWSFVSFLIRIYVNLLIEPTFHPVKHFPVVTVAHKMILPGLLLMQREMVRILQPYLGIALAEFITWFNIFFIPGIFGFAVWELKENWRLYLSNRRPLLTPVAVGAHGESVARLLRPGFHSGTLPRLYRRLRLLEHQPPSFHRFSSRRAVRAQLEHVETAIHNFVSRELIRLLELCPVWHNFGLECGAVYPSSNSFIVHIYCSQLGEQPLELLFQEQSGWVVAGVAAAGFLSFASADQLRSLQHALEGFYRKCGIDMVREQLESAFLRNHPYDINSEGLAIWPHGQFRQELTMDLSRKGLLRPLPADVAATAGLHPVERSLVLFFESRTLWDDWVQRWTLADGLEVPRACTTQPAHLLPDRIE
ncbi:MAG: hypothetical protein ACKO2P_11770 [Planctomycetota bacterium]